MFQDEQDGHNAFEIRDNTDDVEPMPTSITPLAKGNQINLQTALNNSQKFTNSINNRTGKSDLQKQLSLHKSQESSKALLKTNNSNNSLHNSHQQTQARVKQ